MWNRILLTICSVFVLAGPALTGDLTHVPDRDFDTLKDAGNNGPQGIWSDGTTLWVAESGKIYAYNMRSKARDPDKDFNTLSAAGNTSSKGIWSDGTTMWVAESGKIYAYNMRSKAHDPNKDFNTLSAAGNYASAGLWSDGTIMWVVDSAYQFNKIYAYNMRSKAHDPNKDFDKLYAAGRQDSYGIWSDGTTMWVADDYGNKIYAYNMRSKARDSDKGFDLASGNHSPTGIWSDGTTMWVVDDNDDKIYAYGGLAGSSGQGSWSDQDIQDFPMKIKGTTGTLKICIRDHQCEDGDKISVNVDGRTVFSGEIDNAWDCYTLTVWAGESYAVELTALNGTGYKGDCSYKDENTGEIRVTGENTETQVWRHRGGAGSKAHIIVERVR